MATTANVKRMEAPDVSPPPDAPPRRRVALAVCMFLITGVFGFLQTFVSLYLSAAGLNRTQIGLVTGIGTATALLIQPVLGRLSDRVDARRPFMVAAAVASGLAYLTYRQADGLLAFTLLTALGVNGFQYLNSVGGVLVGRLVQGTARGGAATYISYRVWGSVGYIVVAIGAGLLVSSYLPPQAALDRTNLAPVFTYGPLLFFVIAAVSLIVPDPKKPAAAPAVPGRQEARPAAPPAPAVSGMGETSNFNRFLTAFFLYQFALYGASAYLPLYMEALGARPLWITAMFALGVVSEVLVMVQVGRWTDVYGRRPALAFAFLLMPIRLLLYIPATGPLWVLLVQILHGVNFGIVGTIAVVFVNDLAGDRHRGAFQARLAAVIGLALAAGPVACGWLADRFGYGVMFAAMSAVGAVAAVLLLARVRESHPAPQLLTNRGPDFLRPVLRLLAGPPAG